MQAEISTFRIVRENLKAFGKGETIIVSYIGLRTKAAKWPRIGHLLLVEAAVSLDGNSIRPHKELDRQEIDEFEPQLTVNCPRGWQLLQNQLNTDAPEDLSPAGLKRLN